MDEDGLSKREAAEEVADREAEAEAEARGGRCEGMEAEARDGRAKADAPARS
jgi:hypothetical protein